MEPQIDPIHRRTRLVAAAVVLLGLLGVGGVALAHEVGDVVVISGLVTEDLYAAGQSVDIPAEVDGDIVVAGQSVTLSGMVTGDVIAAADSLTLTGEMLDDVRAAGRSLTLTGTVGDHAVVAGQNVVLAASSRIEGFVWAAGTTVTLSGEIGGDLVVAGEKVSLSGSVGGDVEIDADQAVIEEGAHIYGDLVYPEGHAPRIEAGALIDGSQIQKASELVAPTTGQLVLGAIMGIVFGSLSLLVLAAVLRAVTPPLVREVGMLLRERPARTLGIGALALVVTPLVAFLAILTVIGAPLGAVILLAYAIFLVISVPVALDVFVDLLVSRRGMPVSRGLRFAVLALISLIFVAALRIPVLGGLIGLAAVVWGLGALVLRTLRRGGSMTPGVPEPVSIEHTPAEPASTGGLRSTES